MSGEIATYASLVKDVFYGISGIIFFWIVRYPQYLAFAGHAATWVVIFLYYISDNDQFWFPTAAIVLSLLICALDAWIFLTVTCFFGSFCCVGNDEVAPFSFGVKVCGPNDRYETDSLIYIALTTVGFGCLTGISRTMSIYNTRKSSSGDLAAALFYSALKVFVFVWSNVSYSSFFWVQSFVTMAAGIVAFIVSLNFKLVASIIFLGIAGLDLSVVFGATNAVQFLEKSSLGSLATAYASSPNVYSQSRRILSEAEDVPPPPPPVAVVLRVPQVAMLQTRVDEANTAFQHVWVVPPESSAGVWPGVGRGALANAAATLKNYVDDPASTTYTIEKASQIVQTSKDMFSSFILSLEQDSERLLKATAKLAELDTTSQHSDKLTVNTQKYVTDVLAHAHGVGYIVEETYCCDPNTRYDFTILRLKDTVVNFNASFDRLFEERSATHAREMNVALDILDTITRKLIDAASSTTDDPTIRGWFSALRKIIVNIWNKIIGKQSPNAFTPAPWHSDTGKPVSKFIKYLWIGIHMACAVLALLELFTMWSRVADLKTLFGTHPTQWAALERSRRKKSDPQEARLLGDDVAEHQSGTGFKGTVSNAGLTKRQFQNVVNM